MDHHRAPGALGLGVDLTEAGQLAEVGVGGEELVRGMDLEHADAEGEDAPGLGAGVGDVARMHRADGVEPVLVAAHVAGDPVVGRGVEAHDLGRDVVDERRALDPLAVHQPEQLGGVRERLLDLGEVAAAGRHQGPGPGLHLLPGLDVDVAVEDAHGARIA